MVRQDFDDDGADRRIAACQYRCMGILFTNINIIYNGSMLLCAFLDLVPFFCSLYVRTDSIPFGDMAVYEKCLLP